MKGPVAGPLRSRSRRRRSRGPRQLISGACRSCRRPTHNLRPAWRGSLPPRKVAPNLESFLPVLFASVRVEIISQVGAIGSVLSGVARTATPGAKARLPRIHADQEVLVIRDHIPPRMRLAWHAGADDLRALLRVPVACEHPELHHGATDCNRLRGRACVIELSRTLP